MKSICVIGNDGAGKTEQIRLLMKRLKKRGINSYHVQINHLFLRIPFFLQGHGAFSVRGERSQSIKLFKSLRRNRLFRIFFPVIVYLDFILYYFVLKLCYFRSLILFDRYFYDKVIKFTDIGVFNKDFFRFFVKITPRPTKIFLLDLDSEVAYGRKGELTPSILRKRRRQYLRLLEILPVILINANQEKMKINDQLGQQILEIIPGRERAAWT